MAEAAPLSVRAETLAGSTVSADVESDRSLTDPRALSCQLAGHKALGASLIRPLGQGGGPARPAECTARLSTPAVRMVS